MTESADERIRESVDAVYRSESRRILATLIRLLGDFDLAEAERAPTPTREGDHSVIRRPSSAAQ